MKEVKRKDRIKIVAAIPAYNEEQFIGEIVARAKKQVDEVVVADDGSTDNTAQIAKTAGVVDIPLISLFYCSSPPVLSRCSSILQNL